MRIAAAQGVAPSLKGCVYSRYLLDSFQEFFGYAPQTRTKADPAPANTILDQKPRPGQRFLEVKQLVLLLSAGPGGDTDAGRKPPQQQAGGNNTTNVLVGILGVLVQNLQNKGHKDQAPPDDNDGATAGGNNGSSTDGSTDAANNPQTPTDDGTNNKPPPITPPDNITTANGTPDSTSSTTGKPPPNGVAPQSDTPSVVKAPDPPPAKPPIVDNNSNQNPAKPVQKSAPTGSGTNSTPPSVASTDGTNTGWTDWLWRYLPYIAGAIAVLAAAMGTATWLRPKPPAPPVHAASAAAAPMARCAFEPGPGTLVADGPLVSGPKLRIAVTLEPQPGATMLSEAP